MNKKKTITTVQAKKTVEAVDTKRQRAEEAAKKAEAAAKKAEAAAKKLADVGRKQVQGHFGGFIDFVRTQGVIGLAVGLAIGTAAGNTVKDIVNGFISPIVQFIVGSGTTLATATWHIELFGRKADFLWGAAVSSTITLIATALVIYWLVNVFKLDRLDKKKDTNA
ncbi:MAG TPA: MscL family protein [Dongiaceae bacterium]|nr:MscL family protein [Dongiaceae bacterium]